MHQIGNGLKQSLERLQEERQSGTGEFYIRGRVLADQTLFPRLRGSLFRIALFVRFVFIVRFFR